jgi:hypothetical protein
VIRFYSFFKNSGWLKTAEVSQPENDGPGRKTNMHLAIVVLCFYGLGVIF